MTYDFGDFMDTPEARQVCLRLFDNDRDKANDFRLFVKDGCNHKRRRTDKEIELAVEIGSRAQLLASAKEIGDAQQVKTHRKMLLVLLRDYKEKYYDGRGASASSGAGSDGHSVNLLAETILAFVKPVYKFLKDLGLVGRKKGK